MEIISFKKILTKDARGGAEVVAEQPYVDRVKTLVPEIVVSVWLAATALINREAITGGSKFTALWVTFGVALLVTAWLTKQELDKAKAKSGNKDVNLWPQILVTVLSFVFWVLGTGGGPFTMFPWFFDWYGKLAVLLWTLLIAPSIKFNVSEGS
ncbi:MAG: hypothetical protein PWQ55_711 [Chloroflexota bacterium]|nr:hypothetical protein [Chloroflexota bacterium]